MAKAQKFPEAAARIFERIFICRKCGCKNRADILKVKNGKIKCRKCKRRQLRPIRKERKV